jgi:hypothetical protein
MKLTKLSNIFTIAYGNSLELNALILHENKQDNSVNYVSRTAQNNGISAFVEKIENIEPFIAGLITVALSGSVLETFLQPQPFYTGYHVMILTPKREMSELEKLYYCDCIKKNKYRYSYGRQANRTLKDILLPTEQPQKLNNFVIPNYNIELSGSNNNLLENQNLVKVCELFEVHYGTNLALNALEGVEQKDENSVNFVSRTTKNNGVSAFVKILPNAKPLPAGLLSVAAGGSVLETFVQDEPFYTGRDMYYRYYSGR